MQSAFFRIFHIFFAKDTGGGGCGRCDWQEMRKKCGNAAKNAMENAVLFEWCVPLETPMFCLVLHDRALKARTV